MADPEKKLPDNIIVKRKKSGGHGHHGGAWKIAYADFVTAMMAFFLLMWLVSSLNTAQREGIADYFKQPLKVSLMGGPSVGARKIGVKGGGQDVLRKDGEVKNADSRSDRKNILATPQSLEARALEDKQLQQIKQMILTTLSTSPTVSKYKNQIQVDITSEGLRIQIFDKDKRPMFGLGSDTLEPYMKDILASLFTVLNKAPNSISILGHTDAKPYDDPMHVEQTNWELSSQRANAARRELIRAGLPDKKILRVLGYADTLPFDKKNPLSSSNRRISIILMRKEVEDFIRADK